MILTIEVFGVDNWKPTLVKLSNSILLVAHNLLIGSTFAVFRHRYILKVRSKRAKHGIRHR
jgi:hypothetical protein